MAPFPCPFSQVQFVRVHGSNAYSFIRVVALVLSAFAAAALLGQQEQIQQPSFMVGSVIVIGTTYYSTHMYYLLLTT